MKYLKLNFYLKKLKYIVDNIRYRLIIFLSGDYIVILNTKIYDDIIAIASKSGHAFIHNVDIYKISNMIDVNVKEIISLREKGVTRSSNGAIVLNRVV